MRRTAVRLSDVARAAGTSTKTASRVINGDPRVAVETRRRVLDQVDQLGYRVDVMARTLRRGVDDTVGVVVPTIGDPFFATLIEEIERIALGRGTTVLIASNHRQHDIERRIVEGMLSRRVGGLVIAPFGADFGFLDSLPTPVVFLDRHAQGLSAGAVVVDDFGAARHAVHHLARHGHERIALVVDDLDVETSRRRHDGYVAAMTELGLSPSPELRLVGCTDAATAEARTHAVMQLDRAPTAIFSARSETSLGVVRALHLARRTDIALISFGDFVTADILDPAITVLDHDPRQLARSAMGQLLAQMTEGGRRPTHDTVIELTLIPRGSGELAPADRAETT